MSIARGWSNWSTPGFPWRIGIDDGARPMKGLIPRFHQYSDFLSAADRTALLEWVFENKARFEVSSLAGGVIDPKRRISERLTDLGPLESMFSNQIRGLGADVFEKTGTPPFEIEYIELEIAAHGDGAHFAMHTDIPIGEGRKPLGGDRTKTQDRLLSGVYYFYREPKGFSGGQLRLHRFGSDNVPGDYVDLEPQQNSLVIFPSWTNHEVLKVSCPSRAFEDSRFAINCWLCRTLAR
jgi:SM-20-related protein